MRNFSKPRAPRKHYIINQAISSSPLRVIDAAGEQVGVIPRDEALERARQEEVDLILIAPTAKPPVAKLIDFSKFLYQEQKKEKEARRGIKKSIVKDLKLSLFIAEGDRNRMIEKAKEFLTSGNQVRINLTLRGREMGKRDMALEKARQFIEALGEVNVSKEPRIEGRVIRAVVARKK